MRPSINRHTVVKKKNVEIILCILHVYHRNIVEELSNTKVKHKMNIKINTILFIGIVSPAYTSVLEVLVAF